MSHVFTFFLVSLFTFFAFVSSPSASFADPTTNLAVTNNDFTVQFARHYILGPNDVVSINFFGAPELSVESLRIPADGRIMLPGTEYITAAGLTLEQLRDKIRASMQPYLKNNLVWLNLLQAKPFAIRITGAVLAPGTYEININPVGNSGFYSAAGGNKPDRATPLLSSLLLTAGGVQYDADLEKVKIINDFTAESFEINVLDLLTNHPNGDIYLSYGDRIHVDYLPADVKVSDAKFKQYSSATFSPSSFPVRVYGYVRAPGLIQVDPQRSNNLNSAIMQAGGYYTDYAFAPKEITIMRTHRDGKIEVLKVNPKTSDIALLPNDLIYVPERFLGKIDRFSGILGRLVAPAATVAGGINSWALLFDPTRNFRR
ncbi:MAG: polysaccharide export protein [Vampirovibrionales bacterium]|jgi:protein involved in polysaccharide export with SLBB domain|nr:polysaccharide export protein [Vampirovibrionales bacterium]